MKGVINLPFQLCWHKELDDEEPCSSIHKFSRPSFVETIPLLGTAVRVSMYLFIERWHSREPIFDLRGMLLAPPHPGPYAGVPIGGIGSGGIGNGFKGAFNLNRWSLQSKGAVKHGTNLMNCITIRIKRDNESPVIKKFTSDDTYGNYLALFPRSWTIYEQYVPGISVIISKTSPFLPGSYSESCFPVGVIEVEVINHDVNKYAEVSIMMTFQNHKDPPQKQSQMIKDTMDYKHLSFDKSIIASKTKQPVYIKGVCMVNEGLINDQKDVKDNCCVSPPPVTSPIVQEAIPIQHEKYEDIEAEPRERQSYAIAAIETDDVKITGIDYIIENNDIDENGISIDILDSEFLEHGDLLNLRLQQNNITNMTTIPGSALCGSFKLNTESSKRVPFALAWDKPYASFGTGDITQRLPKYYTRFFSTDGIQAPAIATYALCQYKEWNLRIDEWQKPVQTATHLPNFYRHQLFNELYFLVEGKSLWLDTKAGIPNIINNNTGADRMKIEIIKIRDLAIDVKSAVQQLSLPVPSVLYDHDSKCKLSDGDQTLVGQFILIEGMEYLMYNTVDVNFYASYALLNLWPQLELSVQRDVARCVLESDMRIRTTLGEGMQAPRKVRGCVPHDLGSPSDGVFKPGACNAYLFQDVSRWKDLGPKFILQCYRDYMTIGSIKFISDIYDIMLMVMEYTALFDKDGDGMIENEGYPDQTYDIWIASGISAYTGGLYVASCQAMTATAKLMGDDIHVDEYKIKTTKARYALIKTLWNGQYLNYDSSSANATTTTTGTTSTANITGTSANSSIMADMCCGDWYSRVCNLGGVLPVPILLSCLETIFLYNVLRFGAGEWNGAVNGYIPGHGIDDSCLQSKEVWTGTTYALAATFLTASKACENECYDLEEMKNIYENDTINKEQHYSLGSWQQAMTDSVCGKLILPKNFDLNALYLLSPVQRLKTMAFLTAKGIHDAGWCRYGYQFNTPEAWESNGNYRSLSYSRPLAIYAIQHVLEKKE